MVWGPGRAKTQRNGARYVFRSILSGGIWGLLVSGVTLGTASLVGEQPAGDRPPLAPVVEAPGLAEGSGDIVSADDDSLPGGVSDPGGAPAPSETPEVAMPGANAELPTADTESLGAPDAAEAGQGLAAPEISASTPQVGVASEAPSLSAPVLRAPEPPVAEALIEVPTEPAAAQPDATPPAQPLVAPDTEGPTIAGISDGSDAVDTAPVIAETAPNLAPEVAPEAEAVADAASAERPSAEVEGVANQQVALASEPPPAVPDATDADTTGASPAMADPTISDILPATEPTAAPVEPAEVIAVEPIDEPVVDVVVVPDTEAPSQSEGEPASAEPAEPVAPADEVVVVLVPEPEPEPAPEPELAPDVASEPPAPRIALQGGGSTLPGSTDGIRIVRPSSQVEDPAPEDVVEEAIPDDAPALVRFAADYDNSEAKPLMSIILIDDGGLGGGAIAAVSAVPFPVTIALDVAAPDAAEKIASYRAQGIEVMAIASLPEGALPSDVEVTLEAAFGTLAESIGLLDAGAGGLQSDRSVTEQAMARLAQDGRGFITKSQGLNMALRSAEAAGVPASVIYRDLDSEDQDARVIRRFLDQAAFRARQQSGVVMVGRVRADTISALTLWGTANRAGQVSLAPVSAVLNSE